MADDMTNDDVIEEIESEGLGYTIMSGISFDSIADPELKKLWKKAEVALEDIELYLNV